MSYRPVTQVCSKLEAELKKNADSWLQTHPSKCYFLFYSRGKNRLKMFFLKFPTEWNGFMMTVIIAGVVLKFMFLASQLHVAC